MSWLYSLLKKRAVSELSATGRGLKTSNQSLAGGISFVNKMTRRDRVFMGGKRKSSAHFSENKAFATQYILLTSWYFGGRHFGVSYMKFPQMRVEHSFVGKKNSLRSPVFKNNHNLNSCILTIAVSLKNMFHVKFCLELSKLLSGGGGGDFLEKRGVKRKEFHNVDDSRGLNIMSCSVYVEITSPTMCTFVLPFFLTCYFSCTCKSII